MPDGGAATPEIWSTNQTAIHNWAFVRNALPLSLRGVLTLLPPADAKTAARHLAAAVRAHGARLREKNLGLHWRPFYSPGGPGPKSVLPDNERPRAGVTLQRPERGRDDRHLHKPAAIPPCTFPCCVGEKLPVEIDR